MFARLSNIQATATVGQVLQDIAKVVTGTINDKSQLSAFSKITSDIVPGNTNWEMVYPWAYTDQICSYSFRSLCAGQTKYKYARIYVYGNGTGEPFTPEPNGGNAFSKIASSSYYISLHGARSIDTFGAILNPSFYSISGTSNMALCLGDIYVSASNGHLLIYSDNSKQTVTSLCGVFEYPENSVTAYKNLTPFITYKGKGGVLTASAVGKDTGNLTVNVSQMPDGTNATGTTVNVLNSMDGSSTSCMTSFDFGTTASTTAESLESAGSSTLLRSLIFYDAGRMHNYGNCSSLTDVYFTTKTNSRFAIGQRFVSGNSEYVALNLNTVSLLIPRK